MFVCNELFLIVDLESTCCNDSSIAKGEGEIIEIGAVIVEAESLKLIDEFTIFIKPNNHPVLTDFCIELTTITQLDVDNAASFQEAIGKFSLWLQQYQNYIFCSWGNYDRNHIASDCLVNNIKNPLEGKEHVNLKKAFAREQNVKAMGMALALRLAGIKLAGNHHRGIDDVKNIVKLIPYIFGKSKLKDQ